MHTHDLSPWTHDHGFATDNRAEERGTRVVLYVTLAMMLVEIVAGWWFNSMALLADGWHMSSHAVAIGLASLVYALARRQADDARYAFGTWKIEVLGGYTSALLMLGMAAVMAFQSVDRLLYTQAIHYREALPVAVLGLVVNIACVLILARAEGQGHHHHHDDHADSLRHAHPHRARSGRDGVDLNLVSAYLHLIADAFTSVLAIFALIGGWLWGWSWLDPLMGLVGAVLVALWARRLLIDSGKVLLDREMDHPVVDEIREAVETADEAGATRVSDLHVWRVGRNAYACALSLVTHDRTLDAAAVRRALAMHEQIAHVTVEIHWCA